MKKQSHVVVFDKKIILDKRNKPQKHLLATHVNKGKIYKKKEENGSS